MLNPRSLRYMATYDVASNISQILDGGGNGDGNVEAPPDVYGRFGVTAPVCRRDMRRVPRLVDLACAALAEAGLGRLYPGIGLADSNGFGRGSDSGGFGWIPSSPAGKSIAVFYSRCGHFDSIEMNSGFGRIRSRVDLGGFLDP